MMTNREQLLARIRDSNPETRGRALQDLVQLGREAIDILERTVLDDIGTYEWERGYRPRIRHVAEDAAGALEQLYGPGDVDRIMSLVATAVASGSPHLRRALLLVNALLSALAETAEARMLRERLATLPAQAPDRGVRARAIEVLESCGVLPSLAARLLPEERDTDLRWKLTCALRKADIQDPEVARAFDELLSSESDLESLQPMLHRLPRAWWQAVSIATLHRLALRAREDAVLFEQLAARGTAATAAIVDACARWPTPHALRALYALGVTRATPLACLFALEARTDAELYSHGWGRKQSIFTVLDELGRQRDRGEDAPPQVTAPEPQLEIHDRSAIAWLVLHDDVEVARALARRVEASSDGGLAVAACAPCTRLAPETVSVFRTLLDRDVSWKVRRVIIGELLAPRPVLVEVLGRAIAAESAELCELAALRAEALGLHELGPSIGATPRLSRIAARMEGRTPPSDDDDLGFG